MDTNQYDTAFRLDGKVAIVTGGASGIGLASAEALRQAGATVIRIDHSPPAQEDGSWPPVVPADVTDLARVQAVFAVVAQHHGRLDILVNSAGMAIRKPAVDLPLEDWERVMNVNVTGSFLCAREAARLMIERGGGGAIVNVASIMGLSGGGLYPNISYQTSKGAVVNMTRALAVEWAPHGIRVNAVAPTYVRTPFIAALLDQPDLVRKIEDMTPLRRLAEPAEVASAILFLASSAAAMITGHTLPVDGGFLAQ
jgi:NAD(P)-dependent dehydrogenase (short-subunit alcohol dehydrogenase family)